MTSPERTEHTPTERIWLRACLIIWIFLLPISAWLAVSKGYIWQLLSGPVDALAGAFSTIVIGAYVLRRWQQRIEKEHDEAAHRNWLIRNFEFVLVAENAIRTQLARIVLPAYHIYSTLLPDANDRIPDDLLEIDLIRLPIPSCDPKNPDNKMVHAMARQMWDNQRITNDGPAAVAKQQGYNISKSINKAGIVNNKLYNRSIDFLGLTVNLPEEEVPDDERQKATRLNEAITQEMHAIVADSTRFIAEVDDAATRIMTLTGDMTSMDVFEPNELRRLAISLGEQAVQIRLRHARLPSIKSTDLANVERLYDLVKDIIELMELCVTIRDVTYEDTSNLFKLVEKTQTLEMLSNTIIWLVSLQNIDLHWSWWRRDHPQVT
jgi:hypothetical protein